MVRKTDQRTFSKGRRGGEPLLETVTRETVELFNGGRAERKYTSETRDIVTPKSNRYVYLCTYVRHFLLITWIEREKRRERKPDFLQNANEVVRSTRVRRKRCFSFDVRCLKKANVNETCPSGLLLNLPTAARHVSV